jgi:hypothetical protein
MDAVVRRETTHRALAVRNHRSTSCSTRDLSKVEIKSRASSASEIWPESALQSWECAKHNLRFSPFVLREVSNELKERRPADGVQNRMV